MLPHLYSTNQWRIFSISLTSPRLTLYRSQLKNILFIINPISGGKDKRHFPDKIIQHLDSKKFNPDFVFTERVNHARELAEQAINMGVDFVVAVGGDGTINEVASVLVDSDQIMGIIPVGSGNGLARTLDIPINEKKAIQRLNDLRVDRIDSGVFNKHHFFGIAGVGFDAHVSACFARNKTRGLRGYMHTVLSEVISYQPQHYTIEIDGKVLHREAFIISIANSSQYGNNTYIAPLASVKDGLLDVCIIRRFPLYYLPMVGFHLVNKTVHQSKYIEVIKGKEIEIHREKAGIVHLDGEPEWMEEDLQIVVKPCSLHVIY